jgi:hypothetical protein
MTTLHLNLKGEYFDQIKSGAKIHEFRLVSVWKKRIEGKNFDKICIRKGYPKAGDTSRIIERPWLGYEIQEITHPHFGNVPVSVYAIKVN